MITCNCLRQNHPLCGNYQHLSLNLEDLQIPQKCCFLVKNGILNEKKNLINYLSWKRIILRLILIKIEKVGMTSYSRILEISESTEFTLNEAALIRNKTSKRCLSVTQLHFTGFQKDKLIT